MFQQMIRNNATKTTQFLKSPSLTLTTNEILALTWMPKNFNLYTVRRSRSVAVPLNQSEDAFKMAQPFSSIPGLKSFPFIGNTLALFMRKDFKIDTVYIFWKNMYKEFGPILRLDLPFQGPGVALFKPEDIEEMYRITMDNPIRDGLHSLRKVRYNAVNDYFEKKAGLLTEDNEEWWRVRSKVQTPMMKPQNVVRYLPEMDQVTLEFMERIDFFQEKLNEMPSTFLNELYKWALESIGTVAFNRRLGCLDADIHHDSMQVRLINTVNELFSLMHTLEMQGRAWMIFPTRAFRKLTKAHEFFLEIVDSNIQETEKALLEKMKTNAEGELSLMELLLQRDGLTKKDVVTLILDMIFAGIDTTSHSLAFILYCLAKNPKAQRKLQEELDVVLGDGKGTLTKSQLDRLSYLKACVKESMRLFPLTIGQVRKLTKDAVFRGYRVPKGTLVFAMTMISSWDPENYARVDEFIPERWARDQPLGKIHPYAFLPFSHGTRMCIGRRLAEQEMYTFLARALHRYNVEYHYEDIGIRVRLVSVPSAPLKFKFLKRKP